MTTLPGYQIKQFTKSRVKENTHCRNITAKFGSQVIFQYISNINSFNSYIDAK